MIQDLTYERLLQTSQRINWRIEDVIGPDKRMDFSKPFLPESFARTVPLDFLSDDERLKLNQIRAFGYLAMFELVERCILPVIAHHAPSQDGQDPFRTPALAQPDRKRLARVVAEQPSPTHVLSVRNSARIRPVVPETDGLRPATRVV